MTTPRLVLALCLATAMLSGCAAGAAAPGRTSAAQASGPVSPAGQALLARHGLAGKNAIQVIDTLDRMPVKDRPADLRASVRPDTLLLSGDGVEVSLPVPADTFYLSVAPYVSQTHDCFNHALTGCKGELGGKKVEVDLVEAGTGAMLATGPRTLFDNGFVGFWLPRNVTATLRIRYEGKAAEAKVSTGASDPTCATTMQLT